MVSREISMANGWRRTIRQYGGGLATGLAFLVAIVEAGSHPAAAGPELMHAVPAETIKALSHGFNLAGWMDGPGSTPPDTDVLRSLRKAGMAHVRLPVAADRLMRRFTSESDLADQLRAVDQALTVLLSLGYRVSVDLHRGERFSQLDRNDPDESMKSVQEAWSHLARIIGGHSPALVFAELLNEPDIDATRGQIEAAQLGKFFRHGFPRH